MGGTLCISIDVELAWGTWDKPNAETHERCARLEHEIVDSLVSLFERNEIAATWAIVSRLLELDEGRASTTKHGASIWYAPKVVESIRSARVPQDIGSHGYAHIYFGQSSAEQVRADLANAQRVHAHHSLPMTSFVFPRNDVACRDLLRDAGVAVYRGIDRGWHVDARRLGRVPGRLAHVLDQALPLAPRTVDSLSVAGLVELPGSMLLMARNGVRRLISPAITIAKARRGLEAACRAGGTFHLWFHPSNFYFDMPGQLETLAEILRTAVEMRKAGRLTVRPMSSFAAATQP